MTLSDIERRRTVRLKRSALLTSKLDEIDRPAIKIAETPEEYEQALALVYQEYVQSGYVANPTPEGKIFSVYNLLPETAVFVAKSYLTVISTLTQIFDSELFGLPMDSIYREELRGLREEGRKIVELGALATKKDFRWQNLFMYLCQIMYWYAQYKKVNDLCITINPKHVRFYKTIFLFEEYGPEKQYPKVGAPAVLLRLNMDDIEHKLKRVYSDFDFDCNLYKYFHRMNGNKQENYEEALKGRMSLSEHDQPRLDSTTAQKLIHVNQVVLQNLSPAQKSFILKYYPDLQL
ncbi:MAG: hypothetical protein RBT11_09440 [Desulfobacterales bacterium]|jgi:hypothetical protein|nr:hypothetical protein [Desulfobacterales bacterium]